MAGSVGINPAKRRTDLNLASSQMKGFPDAGRQVLMCIASRKSPGLEATVEVAGLQLQLELLPKKPYCVDRLGDPLLIRSRASALRRRHIQVNEPSRCQFLVFDVDRGDARFAVDEAELPQPCWMTISPNGHAHVAYQLNTPVYLQGRAKPLGYLAAVENGVRRKLAADPSYSGFLTHNPVHPDWETLGYGYAVDLEDLAVEVDLGAGPEPVSGVGRNVETFAACRKHAYRAILKHQAQAGADFDGWEASCERWARNVHTGTP